MMCNTQTTIHHDEKQYKKRFDFINKKLFQIESEALKIKAVSFLNIQSFDYIYANYKVNEVFKVKDVGYSIITSKSLKEITFLVIMELNRVWGEHYQDVNKTIEIKQGVYLDLYTGREYRDKLDVKAFKPSYFKSVGDDDLVMEGRIYKE